MTQLRREVAARGFAAGLTTTLTRGGRVISSVGAVLAASFAILLSQPIDLLFQFGFATAGGILLDTLLIRGLLVPAIITKLGARTWWPSRPLANAPVPEPEELAGRAAVDRPPRQAVTPADAQPHRL